jgi:cell division septal protein FtsQ
MKEKKKRKKKEKNNAKKVKRSKTKKYIRQCVCQQKNMLLFTFICLVTLCFFVAFIVKQPEYDQMLTQTFCYKVQKSKRQKG